ncbi:hypothetical protein SLS62_003180 [Diatrype stigma]|uniref:[acyl-carrier-protein] S-malonyltransferase n=1 Tax=Diatrype stigma TaxID=117547 RepID=A0AAN9YRN5_9PEZI
MNGIIEALHIYDEHNRAILSHTYTSRPLSATHLLPLYLEHPAPRPNLIYLSNTNPPTLVFSLVHANLLYLATTSSEIEPLLVLEFLHRIIDALEEFLGAPVLAHKIEANYDVVAQLLTEMCDAGTINTTEPNALRDLVEVEGFLGKLLGSINLPGKPTFATNIGSNTSSLTAQNASALPWRRANVRHTSNELYADIVETLSVTLAPSGRPIAAFANGTIAFTSKVSGVPDIALNLTGPSGKHNLASIMELPVFHPCVRLNRWRERPGELSFVPPDGRFILAGYEVDLLPFRNGKNGSLSSNNLKLPIDLEVKTGIGAAGSDFEVRLSINKIFGISGSLMPGSSGRGGGPGGRGFGGPQAGTAASPLLQDVIVSVPLPSDVRNLSDIRPTRGDANYNAGDNNLEWYIPAKELAAGTTQFGLRCTVVGPLADDPDDTDVTGFGFGKEYTYEEPYQSSETKPVAGTEKTEEEKDTKRIAQNKILMPSSASVSFSVKGWLASGIKNLWAAALGYFSGRGLVPKFPAAAGESVTLCYDNAGEGIAAPDGYILSSAIDTKFKDQSLPASTQTGQGVQKVGMLTPWLDAFPRTARHVIDEIDSIMGYKLSALIQEGPSSALTATPAAQPAIMATSVLILRILEREFGFVVAERADVALGHSLGEFAALVAAGILRFPDALRICARRAEAMAEATRLAREKYGGDYGMVAVVTEPEYLRGLVEAIDEFVGYRSAGLRGHDMDARDDAAYGKPIRQVLIANINSKNQIVLSGEMGRIRELIAHVRQFLGHDPRAVRLHSDSPFHSPIMRPAVGVMRRLLAEPSHAPGYDGGEVGGQGQGQTTDVVAFPGRLECVSNVTARPFGSAAEVRDLLARQCLETVRWWDSIKYLDQERRVRRWVGVGPGKVGRNLVGKEVGMRGVDVVKGGGVWAITDPFEIEDVLKGLEATEGLVDDEEGGDNSGAVLV